MYVTTRLRVAAAGFASALCITSSAVAQGTITGTVIASRDSAPVVQATVFVVGTRLGAVTDAKGRFRIADVPAGAVKLVARRFGFAPDTSAATVSAGAITANFRLQDISISLSAVQIESGRDAPEIAAIQADVLPTTAAITAMKAEETVNMIDTHDAVKYLPTIFMRKRNNGDTQVTFGTRVWGTSSSARTLIFADGVPLNSLVANNNTLGGPRWGLVAPSEIKRIDVMFGPFSAAYAGNSMGAVMEITTRLPDKFEGSVNQTQALQTHSLYGTKDEYMTSQTTLNLGNRWGKFAMWGSGNYQKSASQPLAYVTSGGFPANTSGAYPDSNKLNASANVLGASGLLHTDMTNVKLKAAYELSPTILAAVTLGYWENDANSRVQSYLTNTNTNGPTFAGQAGFATSYYNLVQQHNAQTASLRSDTKGAWDFELVGTRYSFDKDQQRSPTTASGTDTTYGTNGRAAVLDGTGWYTIDAKGTLRPGSGKHAISAGIHTDRYTLDNTTYNTTEWRNGALGTVATIGEGKTEMQALWVQDAWQISDKMKLTVGGRYEKWRAFDGFNQNGATTVNQPGLDFAKFSPKAVFGWSPNEDWAFTASLGQAYRFATASELYQLVTTGATFTSPNPNIKPDNVLASELRIERLFDRGRLQLSIFNDDVHDAIISQFLPLVQGSPTLYSYAANVDHVRATGAELLWGSNNVFIRGLELSGNVTYLHARTLEIDGAANAGGTPEDIEGKRLPNIPDWRGTLSATYRPNEKWSFNLAGRYSDRVWTTLDNADVRYNTYQGFTSWFVLDSHINHRLTPHWTLGGGIDNMLNRKYFLFHPFPQRTFVANLKYGF